MNDNNNIFTINNSTIRQAVDLYFTDKVEATTKYGKISTWDTSNVTDMKELFKDKKDFNEDISSWDVSNVTDMSFMFYGAKAFNQPLSSWNVSNVTNIRSIFNRATSFNQSLSDWDVSNVTCMNYTFCCAVSFNQPVRSAQHMNAVMGIVVNVIVADDGVAAGHGDAGGCMRDFVALKSEMRPVLGINAGLVFNIVHGTIQRAQAFDGAVRNLNVAAALDAHAIIDGQALKAQVVVGIALGIVAPDIQLHQITGTANIVERTDVQLVDMWRLARRGFERDPIGKQIYGAVPHIRFVGAADDKRSVSAAVQKHCITRSQHCHNLGQGFIWFGRSSLAGRIVAVNGIHVIRGGRN